MVYKKIIFFYCCVVSLSGQYIPADKVDNQKASIKLKSCTTMICYLDTIKKINKKDSHTTIENNNIFSIYLVNIDNIIATKNEYFDLFPNLVVQSGSNSNNKNTHLEKQIITAYKTALNYYKNKNYQESYKLFNILFKKNLNDPNINFYLGRNAFELQKYQEALVAYERVLFEKPDSLRTQFEVGKTHFFNQDYKSAKSVFEVLLSNQKLSTNVKKSIEQYLSAIEEKRKKHFIQAIVIAGVQYDSNINSRSTYDFYDIPGLNEPATNTVEDVSAWAHQEIGIFNYTYKKSNKEQIKISSLLFNKQMFSSQYDDKDIALVSVTPAYNFQYNPKLSVDYGVFIDYLKVANTPYMKTYGLIPKLTYLYNKNNTISTQLKYQIKQNQQLQNETKDSTYIQLNGSLKHIYTKNISITPSFTFSSEKKKYTNLEVIDNTSYTLGVNLNYIYKPFLIFTPALSYKQTKYQDEDTTYHIKRDDKELQYTLTTNYIYKKKWIGSMAISYTDQQSNIPPNEYDKYTFGINIIRSF